MKKFCLAAVVCVCPAVLHAQLSQDQKVQDFQSIVSLYAKQYAPYSWKKQLFGFDLFDTAPWLDRVKKSKNDLEFYEAVQQYVASLNDIHSAYFNPSDFEAYLGFRVDIYDGKTIIDFVNRTYLPARQYPFVVGDELVSVDNKTPDMFVQEFTKFNSFGNPRSTQRFVTELITDRVQAYYARAEEVGDNAIVVIRRQNGNLETYTIPWVKFGTPLTQNGPVPTPHNSRKRAALVDDTTDQKVIDFRRPLLRIQNMYMPEQSRKAVRNIGARAPIFAPPQGFPQRLGRSSNDFFYSGTYKAGDKTIGLIRISDFEPIDFSFIDLPEGQFAREIAFMKRNTDALVIDVMRNPGGFGCYAEDLMSSLTPYSFHGIVAEFRPTLADVQAFNQAIQDATDAGADQWEIDLIQAYASQVTQAFNENRGMTGPLPLCNVSLQRDPATDSSGAILAYDKPILLLTDEFSISAADFFAAMFQDARRGKIFGMRTSGAGGSIQGFAAGFYSEGFTTVTQTLGIRQDPIVTPDYPTAPLIENIGVRPDIQFDYMTRDNLLAKGGLFVDAFTQAVLGMIQ